MMMISLVTPLLDEQRGGEYDSGRGTEVPVV